MKISITRGRSQARVLNLATLAVIAVAIAPILQNYKGVINGGVTVIILAMVLVLALFAGRPVLSSRCLNVFGGLYLFQVYKIIDHGTSASEMGLVLVYFVFTMAFLSGCLEAKKVIKVATVISMAACVGIILQYFCYYLLHFHLKMVPTSLLLKSANQWVKLANTGRYSITGRPISFYRPSAFFLEPSHMFIYLFAPLVYEIYHSGAGFRAKRKAIFLSAGMILSTSGMAIIATVLLWLVYLSRNSEKRRYGKLLLPKLLQPRNLSILLLITAVLVFMFFKVDFFHRSVIRIFSSGSDYKNAVSGRVEGGYEFIRQMHGWELVFGISDHYSGLDFHMTGFNATMYKFGIVGTLLSYLFYLKCLIDLRGWSFWLAAFLIGLSFFTPHTHGTFYMLFFIVFLTEGYHEKGERRRVAASEMAYPTNRLRNTI